MKNLIIILLVVTSGTIFSQKNYNIQKGYMAEGYDVVAYFNNKAVKGDKQYIAKLDGVSYKFSTQENLQKFKRNPEKYMPQYGGYCAYAIGLKGEKVGINPKTYEIRDGKLYLFYNSWGTNTLKLWKKEGAKQLKDKADKNWKKLVNNK